MLLPIFISYAEIHYHLKRFFPLYYKKMPEIIADIPSRSIINKDNTLPVLIIIKDSHLFPITLKQINVTFRSSSDTITKNYDLDLIIDSNYFSRILLFPLKDISRDEKSFIDVEFLVVSRGKEFRFFNDNYDLPYKPFKCFISREPLPYPRNWYAGDPHYHSNYTEDQVEFGADIPATIEMAKAMGISWFFVTDHSYDLDDSLEDYTKNDSQLPKWKKMQNEIRQISRNDVKVIPGEEVSIGNHLGKNVHLLAINVSQFIEGKGDGAEKWFHNKPTTSIKNIPALQSRDNLFIAAHPWENVPLMQRLTLKRDSWHPRDFSEGNITFLQIINGSGRTAIKRSIKNWTKLLLTGRKMFIVAGNDAHGNFNIMRQIKLPFLKLFSNRKQIFGKFHTVFNFPENDPVRGIKNGRMIVSNGPFLDFHLRGDSGNHYIGTSINNGTYNLYFQTATTPEFGNIKSVRLILGDLFSRNEKIIDDPTDDFELQLTGIGYIRMELETEFDGLVLTNPLWFDN
jgi:hypothetical protein